MSPHPIERLRWVARAEGAGPSLLVREAAGALASIGDDLAGLVTGCRRLIDRHPAVGPMWWLSARVLASSDPVHEAYQAAAELDADPTSPVLAAHLPADTTVTVLGWPEQAGDALHRRGDLEVLVVDSRGEGTSFARRLVASGVEAFEVREAGVAGAVRESGLVLIEASAVGPSGCIATAGSAAAAAVAAGLGIDVCVVAGAGRVLPGRLWDALLVRLAAMGDAWELDDELVPREWVNTVSGPTGGTSFDEALQRADCPVVPELLGWGS